MYSRGRMRENGLLVIIYSVLYLPICTLADNAPLNKKTQEMESKENVSMNPNALSWKHFSHEDGAILPSI